MSKQAKNYPAIIVKCLLLLSAVRAFDLTNRHSASRQSLCNARIFRRGSVIATSVLPATSHLAESTGGSDKEKCEVKIIGGGPAGLLTAHAILSRNEKYRVSIFESLEDPRLAEPGPRTYSLGLNIRGQTAIKYFDQRSTTTTTTTATNRHPASYTVPPSNAVGDKSDATGSIWGEIEKNGIYSEQFFLHINKIKLQIRKPAKEPREQRQSAPPPTLLVSRKDLCGAMLSLLESRYQDTGRFSVHFDTKLQDVDLESRKIVLGNGEQQKYDLLVGCDGVRSVVRRSMMKDAAAAAASATVSNSGSRNTHAFYSEEVVLPGNYKVMLQQRPEKLEPNAIHLMEAGKTAGFGLFVIPATGDRVCTLLNWKTNPSLDPVRQQSTQKEKPQSTPKNAEIDDEISGNVAPKAAETTEIPLALRADTPIEEAQRLIVENYPLFGTPSEGAVAQLQAQRPSEARTVRCNRYHHSQGSALLLGDAAHSTGGTLGQGANSALMDVVALSECLDATGDNIAQSLPMFSEKQVKEGLALWELLQLPPKKNPIASLRYQLLQGVRGLTSKLPVINRLLPDQQPTQTLLSQTLTPFSKIVAKNQNFIDLATEPFTQIKYTPEYHVRKTDPT